MNKILLLMLTLTFFSFSEDVYYLDSVSISYPKIVPVNDLQRCMLAYRDGRLDEFWKYVEKYGPNIGNEYSTILSNACSSNDSVTIKKLIYLGADIAAFDNRALYSAIMQSRVASVRLLLENGAPLEIKRYNKTMLEIAIDGFSFFSNYDPQSVSAKNMIENELEIIQLLIKAGADLKVKTSNNLTYSEYVNKIWTEKKPLPHDDYIGFKKRMLEIIANE